MSTALLRDTIAAQLIGRDREASIITLALLAREHVLLVGPPGTAKSHLCRTAASTIDGARYFERLLSPTTAPEALWGPVSISALRADRYEHVTDGYLATAHVAFLDEVGRASAAILDSLLHALGPERQALVGTQQIKMPLVTAIGSANTWPEDAAMLDRWLLRAQVNYLAPSQRRALLTFRAPALTPAMTLADLDNAQTVARCLPWSPDALDTFDAILADLDEAGIAVSDRRLRASEKIAQAAAFMRGGAHNATGNTIQPIDLEALQFVLWAVPDQAPVAASKVVARANPLGAKLDAMLAEADELARAAVDSATRLDAATKLDMLLAEAKKVANEPGANGRAAKAVRYIEREHKRIQGRILGLSEDKINKMLEL